MQPRWIERKEAFYCRTRLYERAAVIEAADADAAEEALKLGLQVHG